jgi:RNA polymerase sigma-70 factor (ECF subfamily)
MEPLFNGTRLPGGEAERCRAKAELVRMAGGDREALAGVYERYSPGIYGYIRSIVRDADEAEDLTQQVFIKLLAAPHLSFSARDFAPWLLRVARNTALDSLRRRQRMLLRDPHEWTPDGAAPDEETRRSLGEALSALSRGQRYVLVLRDVLGYTPGEAAKCLGKSDGAVHMLHHRARRTVRERLSGSGSAPCTRRAAARAL